MDIYIVGNVYMNGCNKLTKIRILVQYVKVEFQKTNLYHSLPKATKKIQEKKKKLNVMKIYPKGLQPNTANQNLIRISAHMIKQIWTKKTMTIGVTFSETTYFHLLPLHHHMDGAAVGTEVIIQYNMVTVVVLFF